MKNDMKFNCSVNIEEILRAIKNHECYDSWGEVQYGDEQRAVDFNICIDNTGEETLYPCAFYKLYADDNGTWICDFSKCYSVDDINFEDADLETNLKEEAQKAFKALWES